ncbi:MAG TPA: cation diffusion facilitator family transporter, partial [Burkholderiaceae bacterium]|nr:cation diffusion facilitator family transporter [Burkholderiaceae bacterium]
MADQHTHSHPHGPAHDHDHDHDHGHSHAGHSHAHASRDFSFAFAVGTALNLGFVAAEAAFGIIANSMALLADAGHNLSDVLGLLIAWGAAALTRRGPTARYTYGLRSSSILAALFNAIILLLAVGGVAWEAIRRFADPEPVASVTVMIVAAIG